SREAIFEILVGQINPLVIAIYVDPPLARAEDCHLAGEIGASSAFNGYCYPLARNGQKNRSRRRAVRERSTDVDLSCSLPRLGKEISVYGPRGSPGARVEVWSYKNRLVSIVRHGNCQGAHVKCTGRRTLGNRERLCPQRDSPRPRLVCGIHRIAIRTAIR